MRSFTIDSIKTSKSTLRFSGGRYMSDTPMGAAKKAFSQACSAKSKSKACSFTVTIQETTQNSAKKMYTYKVTRKYNPVDVTLKNGEMITFKYQVKAKSS